MKHEGLEALMHALQTLGVPMRIMPQHDPKPQHVPAEALDLMWTEADEPFVVHIQRTTYRAPAPDAPDEYNEVTLERLIVERYVQ
jgi:hypothetical protein